MSSYQLVKVLLLFQVLLVEHLINCDSFNHTAGSREPFGSNLMYSKDLFTKTTENPKNYSIAFKYHANSFTGPPFFVQFNVNGAQHSSAKIEHTQQIDSTQDRTVDAFVNIKNATKLTASIEIRGLYGIGSDSLEGLGYLLARKIFKTRSYAAICIQNVNHHREQRGSILEIGKREPNDILIYLRKEFIDARYGNFPRYIFDFEDRMVNISHVVVTADSPYVVIFKNKILMSNHRFRATIYGLSRNAFNAALIIHGSKTFRQLS